MPEIEYAEIQDGDQEYLIPVEGYNYGCKQELRYPLSVLPMRHPTDTIVSPRIGHPRGVDSPVPLESDEYKESCEELMEVQSLVKNRKWPADWLRKHHPYEHYNPHRIPEPLADKIKASDPYEAAMFVYNDPPWTVPFACLQWLIETGVPTKKPSSNHNDMHDKMVNPIETIGDALKRNMRKCFESKYWFGRKRIWEVYGTTDNQWVLAPTTGHHHPAYPAGHATAAGCSICLESHFHLDKQQKRTIRDAAFLGAMLRTPFGAHVAEDNLAGLKLAGVNLIVR